MSVPRRPGEPSPTRLALLLGVEPSDLQQATSTAELASSEQPTQYELPHLDGDATVSESTRIGQLQLLRLLGRGAFGDVYAAYDPVNERTCAVKVLRGPVSPGVRARFRREAQAAMELRHENLLEVYAYGDVQEAPYLLMEYVAGRTLKVLMRQGGALAPPRAARLIHQLARGLAVVHEAGAVHRDVKPANILISRDGVEEQLKLTDFGLVRMAHEDLTRVTGAEALGTPAYMAPEQARAPLQARAPADIYSAGVILYELIVGRSPFLPQSVAELIGGTPPRAPPAPPDAQGLGPIAMKMLSIDPALRPSAAEVVSAVEGTSAFKEGSWPPPYAPNITPPGVEVRTSGASGWRRNFILTLAVVFILVAAATVELSRPTSPDAAPSAPSPVEQGAPQARTVTALAGVPPHTAIEAPPEASARPSPPPTSVPPRKASLPDPQPPRATPAPEPGRPSAETIGRILSRHGLRTTDLPELPVLAARVLEIEGLKGAALQAALVDLQALAARCSGECRAVRLRLGRVLTLLREPSAELAPGALDVLEGQYLELAAQVHRASGDCNKQSDALRGIERALAPLR